MKGPFTAQAEISGPFKFDTKPVTIEGTVGVTATEPAPAAAPKNYVWVLVIIVVVAIVAFMAGRGGRQNNNKPSGGRYQNLE